MLRTLLRLAIACVLVVVGWGSSASAWDTTAGNDTNYGSITFGGTGTDYGYGVAVDGSGNVYTTGYFEGTVDFGAGDVTSAGDGLCALGADGGLFDMLGAQHNTALRAHTNPNTTAIDTTG